MNDLPTFRVLPGSGVAHSLRPRRVRPIRPTTIERIRIAKAHQRIGIACVALSLASLTYFAAEYARVVF